MAASDIGDVYTALQLFDHAVECWQPGADQVGVVAGPEEAFGAAEQTGAVIVPAEPLARTEGLPDLLLVQPQRRDDLEGVDRRRFGFGIFEPSRQRELTANEERLTSSRPCASVNG